jgi:hypothetical protein
MRRRLELDQVLRTAEVRGRNRDVIDCREREVSPRGAMRWSGNTAANHQARGGVEVVGGRDVRHGRTRGLTSLQSFGCALQRLLELGDQLLGQVPDRAWNHALHASHHRLLPAPRDQQA